MSKPNKAQRRAAVSPDAILQAAALHQGGQLAQAERLYDAILAADPNHFDALHLLGVLRHQQGRSIEALKLIAKALRRNAASADALSNYGVVLNALQRHEEAVAAYDRALALNPDQADALSNRGSVLCTLGRAQEGLASCDRALALNPNHADAHCNRGAVLMALARHAEAVAAYDRALALRPQHVDALEGRGGALIELGRHEEALRTLNQALALSPKNKVALARRGNALFELGRYAESLASYDAALAIDPHFPGAHNNRGYALLALSRLDEALASYQTALEHKPQSLEALNNIGNVLAALDHYDEAERFYDRAAALAPDRAEAKWNKGLLYLSLGRLAEGWELFEQRFHGGVKDLPLRAYPQPRWSGGKVAGELLVWGEQGLGDQIIYASMIPDLFPLADSVVLELDPRLVPLFARSFPQARVVPLCAQPYPGPIVAHTPVGSLGRLLRPTFDAFPRRENGYLVADPVRVAALRQRLASDGSKVIGLSWRSVARLIGTAKTAQLADFEALLRLPGCRFVDLQYGDTCADCASVERELGIRIERLGDIDNTNDIDGLAALITACDAVATVSNTTAHLAGALGRPTWIFAPFGNARIWYWFRQRSDSPWYPHVRLCRQQQGESWVNLITSAVPQLSTSLAKV